MKRKILISVALTLLIAALLFMTWDMFFSGRGGSVSPEPALEQVNTADTICAQYNETMQFGTGLEDPRGIAVDLSGRIYVCGGGGVAIFDREGKREGGFHLAGTANCIYPDLSGKLYLGMGDRIEIRNPSGKELAQWESCGEESIITSVAAAENEVFIADAGNKIVFYYTASGKMIGKFGTKDPERGIPGFVIPSPYFDLGFGKKGELWIVNPGRHKFEQYDREGSLIASWGESSLTVEGFCGCCNPSNFAVMSDGSFVTAEKGIERIKIYRPDGSFSCLVAGPESFIEGTRGIDLAVDSRDRIIVLDPGRNQVRIFVKKDEGNE